MNTAITELRNRKAKQGNWAGHLDVSTVALNPCHWSIRVRQVASWALIEEMNRESLSRDANDQRRRGVPIDSKNVVNSLR